MKMVPLGEVAQINPRPPKISGDTEVAFVGMADLDAIRAKTGFGQIRPFAEVSKGYTTFQNGDILAAKITPCYENNKIGQARLQRDIGVGSTEFHVIRPGDELDDRYVLHFLRQDQVRRQGELRMTGSAGQRRVPVAFVQELKIPLPPIEEQRRIAAILDQTDDSRSKCHRQLQLLDDLLDAVFRQMFRDDLHGAQAPLAELVAEFRYGTSTKSTPTGHPVLRIPNVVGGELDFQAMKYVELDGREFQRLRLIDGDLLFVRTNGNPDYVGRCAAYDSVAAESAGFPGDDIVYASYLIRARLKQAALPGYLSVYLNGVGRQSLRRNAKTSAGQYNINIDGLGSVLVPVPSLDRQSDFVARVEEIKSTKRLCGVQLERLDDFSASLQSRAFAGRL